MKLFVQHLCLILVTTLFIACGGNENDDDIVFDGGVTQIMVRANKNTIVYNPDNQEAFTFRVLTNSGVDITNQSLLYIDNTELSSTEFTPVALASYKVKARYQNMESEEITINVVDILSTYYKHKVVIEDFTGTWCGWCTRIAYGIELLKEQTHDIIPIAIHNNDEYDYNGRLTLENYIGVNGAYPYATINRKTVWEPLQHQNTIQPLSKIQEHSPIGIKIHSDLGATSGTISIGLTFKEQPTTGVKYVAYILEDGLIADQKNYYATLYGGIMPTLPNFVHNHTLRAVQGNILGNTISQNFTIDQEISLENLPVNYTSEDVNQLYVVVMVIDSEGQALNAQIAKGNTAIDYQYAN